MDELPDMWRALGDLKALGIDRYFGDIDFRNHCKEELVDLGCPRIAAGWAVDAIFGLCSYCADTLPKILAEESRGPGKALKALVGEGAKSNLARALVRLVERTPGVSKLFARLLTVAGKLSDEHRHKDDLLRALREGRTEFTVPADPTTKLEILQYLFEQKEREKLLATLQTDIAAPLRALGAEVDAFLTNFYAPILEDPRLKGRVIGRSAESWDTLLAYARRDGFRDRGEDFSFLERFLGDPASPGPLFQWTLLTGPGGQGKTRLAIELVAAVERAWLCGFLSPQQLEGFDPERWPPPWPTLIVVDYPAQAPQQVHDLLAGFARRAAAAPDAHFVFPVRVLLLERGRGEWFKTVVPASSDGRFVAQYAYPTPSEPERPLRPLSEIALTAIMRDRLPGVALSDAALWTTLRRVDPHVETRDGVEQIEPRPLFAAATALAIAEAARERGEAPAIAAALQRRDVLSQLLRREREKVWAGPHPGLEEDRIARRHENLLIVATMALDLDRERFDAERPDFAAHLLPAPGEIEAARYARMSGAPPRDRLRRLEPDILGEYFALSTLEAYGKADRQPLIDAALELGGEAAAAFLVNAARDFPQEWRRLGFLRPARGAASIRAFVRAAVDQVALLGESDFAATEALLNAVAECVSATADLETRTDWAMALYNKGFRLGALQRSEEAIAVYDEVAARFGDDDAPALREPVAAALYNKGVTLAASQRSEEAIAVYDEVAARFGDDDAPALRELVAGALYNKGVRLGALQRSEEAIAVYDEVAARFGDDDLPALREQVAMALVNKGVTLGALQRSEEAIAVYDEVAARFGDDDAPALREQVAMALVNKGVTLGALQRSEEEIAVYDEVAARFGDDDAPALRAQVAMALVNKGVTLGALQRSEEEIAVYDEVAARFGDDDAPALREQVAMALYNKGVKLGAADRKEDAIRVFELILLRFREDSAPALQQIIARTQAVLDIMRDRPPSVDDRAD